MSDLDRLIQATVKLRTATQVGTGFFVAPDLIATCEHVTGGVGNAVAVECSDGTALEGKVTEADAEADVALVEVAGAAGYPALLLVTADDALLRSEWLAYGFPAAAGGAPVLSRGTVELVATQDRRQRPAIQLKCPDATGSFLRGYSGAAVVARGRVIGQLRSAPEERGGGTQLGAIFAAPSAALTRLAGARIPEVPRRRRRPKRPNTPYDPTWYVHRTAEEQIAAEHLSASGNPVVISGPELFGKSSLLRSIVESARNTERLSGRDARIADIDFGELNVEPDTPLEAFYYQLFEAILRELQIDHQPVLAPYAAKEEISGPSAKALLHDILSRSRNPLYLVLSRAEAVIDWKALDNFARALKAWASNLQQPAFQRLRILAEFSTAPALARAATPSFNVAQHIRLGDLDPEQALELARLYELDWTRDDIAALFQEIGGHPHLLQCAMFAAATSEERGVRMPVEQIVRDARDGTGVFRDFLHSNIEKIRRTETLREAACHIVCGRRVQGIAVDQLLAAGILRRGERLFDLQLAYPFLRRHLEEMCAL